MSWFNLYIKERPIKELVYNPQTEMMENKIIGYEKYFDQDEYEYCQKWIHDARENRGKNIKFYDDITNEELLPAEIKRLENTINGDENYVYIPVEDEDLNIEVTRTVKTSIPRGKRKYKPRIPISTDLRRAVYELFDKACRSCGNKHANQIHHIDGDPSNNHIKNLELLCYDCHLATEGKVLFRTKMIEE